MEPLLEISQISSISHQALANAHFVAEHVYQVFTNPLFWNYSFWSNIKSHCTFCCSFILCLIQSCILAKEIFQVNHYIPSASTSLIISWSSASVGFCPRDLITVPSSLVVIVPSPSLSKSENASLNSEDKAETSYGYDNLLSWTELILHR